jgi:hypothetical protein
MDIVVIMNFFGRETRQVKGDLHQEIARNPGLQSRQCHGHTSAFYSAQLQTVPEAIAVRAWKRRPRDAPMSLTKSPTQNPEAVGAAALLTGRRNVTFRLSVSGRRTVIAGIIRGISNQHFTV